MPSEDAKMLEFDQYQKLMIHGYRNNPKNLSKIKVSEHIPLGFSMCTNLHLEYKISIMYTAVMIA